MAFIRAGSGGCYLVAELGIAGFKLRLHDIDHTKLSDIRERGGIDVEGRSGGFAAVEPEVFISEGIKAKVSCGVRGIFRRFCTHVR